ncbi:Innexin [Meloidogyne graminicola]|uniref:Innexin n=1 Tax=Meloidogyne graminicola TaxID=189291 RepID=A0A8T0A3F3_9BILA|nr:Innexin [Meloidogyne graminicola]
MQVIQLNVLYPPILLVLWNSIVKIIALCWRMLSNQSGLNVSVVLSLACQDENVDPEVRDRSIDILTRHIDDALRYQRDLIIRSKGVFLFALINIGRLYGAYVTLVYSIFLGTADYPLFGGHVIYDLFRDREWQDSGRFPRVTLCDFEIRVLGNIHRHTVQCVLVINMFLEKIFVFLWLWLLFLAFLSIFNLSAWLATVAIPLCRQAFIEKFLDLNNQYEIKTTTEIHLFVEKFLRPDGVFLLKMVSVHAGNIICTKLCESLWLQFQQWRASTKILTSRKESSPSLGILTTTKNEGGEGGGGDICSSFICERPKRRSSTERKSGGGGGGITTTSYLPPLSKTEIEPLEKKQLPIRQHFV